MSYSGFSTPASTEIANYTGLSKYAQMTGLSNLYVSKPTTDVWAQSAANWDWSSVGTSTNIPDFKGSVLANAPTSAPAQSFTFVTAPTQVSYSQSAEVQQVSIFGTNNPPLTVAGNNSGELQLNEALMEGFMLGKQVLKPIDDLLKMQEVTLSNGFVNVPVYTVYAGQSVGSGRAYGNFVIESIQFDEMMRDMTGKTTRAMVSVNFREAPAYQVNTGRDQASTTTQGQQIKSTNNAVGQAAGQDARTRTANGAGGTAAGGGGGSGGGAGGGATSGGSTNPNAGWQGRYQALRGRRAKF